MIIALLTSKYFISHHHSMPTGRRYKKYDIGRYNSRYTTEPAATILLRWRWAAPIATAVSTVVVVVYVTKRVPYYDTHCTPKPLLSSFFFSHQTS